MMYSSFKYRVDGEQPLPGHKFKGDGLSLYPYKADKGLAEAVNLAIELKRPLLLEGEPGSGKTQLAYSIAYQLAKSSTPDPERLPLEVWYVTSTSRAVDGLYRYDAINELRDAQLESLGKDISSRRKSSGDFAPYIYLEPLGRAFHSTEPKVLLIDEIDKADIDFPNDLLRELDTREFVIREIGELITAKNNLIIIITSNSEKRLPDAFLRRCLYYYIPFPSREHLLDILHLRFQDSDSRSKAELVVDKFMKIRKKMDESGISGGKKISTSELIDWFKVLNNKLSIEDMKRKFMQGVPFPSALLKSYEDSQFHLFSG